MPTDRDPLEKTTRARRLVMLGLASIGLVTFLGCDSLAEPEPSPLLSVAEMARLQAAEATWNARDFDDYAFEYSWDAGWIWTGWISVEVVGGVVRRAVQMDTGRDIDVEGFGVYPTIEEQFGALRQLGLRDEYIKDVRVEFDPALGFPSAIYFDATHRPDLMDHGSTQTRYRNVRALID